MPLDTPALVTVDVGGTIGLAERPGITATLVSASPLDSRTALRVLRDRLHTAPTISGQVVEDVCGALRIPLAAFPREAAPSPLRMFSAAPIALQEISAHLPVVTLSNVTCVEADLDRLAEMLAPWVVDHFPSYLIGYAKPDRRAFEAVAGRWGISTGQIVHIGDHWECDILGAIRAGARAIWVSGGRPTPGVHRLVRSNVRVAADLAAAAGHVRDLCARRHR